jgi:hypothetical protein
MTNKGLPGQKERAGRAAVGFPGGDSRRVTGEGAFRSTPEGLLTDAEDYATFPPAPFNGERKKIKIRQDASMKKRSVAVLLIVLVLGAYPARAMNGHDLADGMKSYLKAEQDYAAADYLLAGNYMGYIQGVAEATVSDYSLPSGVTPDTLYKIVADYLQKNPEKWDKPASFLVRSALIAAYPKYLIRNK